MTIPGKVNFLQMGRYGEFSEQTYRNNFENEAVDWFAFNEHLVRKVLDGMFLAIAVDPLLKEGFHVISRLRNDAVLFYPTLQKPTGKRGHPKHKAGLNDCQSTDLRKLEFHRNASFTSINIAKVACKQGTGNTVLNIILQVDYS